MCWHDARMNIAQWWQALDPGSRDWLIEHNGEALTEPIVAAVMSAAEGATDTEWWAVDAGDGPHLTDSAVDWIEAVANEEEPTDT